MLKIFAVILSIVTPAPNIERSAQYWRGQMDLTDWQIKVQIVSREELGHGLLGDVEPQRLTRVATIRLLREEESPLPRRLARAEQLVTLVHEMVHLRKYVNNDGNWRSEGETDREAGEWIRGKRRWREALVVER